MKWKQPPIIKIYEALGAVSDGRIEISGNTSKVYSSTGNKFYTVSYDSGVRAIMSNDNGSYWKGYLGYPSIAFLMKTGVLSYEPGVGDLLKGIPWKDINQKFRNDFQKTLEYILSTKSDAERTILDNFTGKVSGELKDMKLGLLGSKTKPPEGY